MTLRLSEATLGKARGSLRLPGYDRAALATGVLHFGPGAFHRAHQASYFDELAAQEPGWGITGVSLNGTGVQQALAPQDGLYTLVTRGTGGEARIVGALRETLVAPRQRADVIARLCGPGLKLITATVTEKGYPIDDQGSFDPAHPVAVADLSAPERPVGLTGWLVEGLRLRRERRLEPPVVISCDNLDRNGLTLGRAVVAHARLLDPALADWIAAEVRFPDSMVDSITPATTDALRGEVARRTGLVDLWPVEREVYRRWVIGATDEPALARLGDVGVILTRDVDGHSQAKLRILNAVHSTLAYCGLLRGYGTVAQAMGDPQLAALCLRMVREDVLPTLRVPSLDLTAYADEILRRIADPAIEHRLEQIALDGSRKLSIRVLPTIVSALSANRPVARLVVPLAAWMRYVVQRARADLPIVDPDAPALVRAGLSCTGESASDVANFQAAYPHLGHQVWRDPRVVDALQVAYLALPSIVA